MLYSPFCTIYCYSLFIPNSLYLLCPTPISFPPPTPHWQLLVYSPYLWAKKHGFYSMVNRQHWKIKNDLTVIDMVKDIFMLGVSRFDAIEGEGQLGDHRSMWSRRGWGYNCTIALRMESRWIWNIGKWGWQNSWGKTSSPSLPLTEGETWELEACHVPPKEAKSELGQKPL